MGRRSVHAGPRIKLALDLLRSFRSKMKAATQGFGAAASQRPIGRLGVHLASKTHHFVGYFQRLSRVRAIESSRLMERAMGIEPTSETWEAVRRRTTPALFSRLAICDALEGFRYSADKVELP